MSHFFANCVWVHRFAIVVGCLLSAACSSNLDGRGLSPTLDASDLRSSTANIVEVRDSLVLRSGLTSVPQDGSADWGKVVLSGFSYVDEKCNTFIDDMFAAERIIRAGRNQLASTSEAAIAILGLVKNSHAFGIVATAFGLANKTLDNYEIVRLINIGPEKIRKIVTRSTQAYRSDIFSKVRQYSTQTVAMDIIGGYVNLCRVPTILAQIDGALEAVDFLPDQQLSRSIIPALRVVSGGEPQAPVAVAAGARTQPQSRQPWFIPDSPRAPLVKQPGPKLPPSFSTGAASPAEASLSLVQIEKMQLRLCIGNVSRKFDAATRAAISVAQEVAKREGNYSGTTDGVLRDQEGIHLYIDILGTKACAGAAAGWRDPYEKFQYPNSGTIKALQKSNLMPALAKIAGVSAPLTVAETGIFDNATRAAIAAIQKHANLPANGTLNAATEDEIANLSN